MNEVERVTTIEALAEGRLPVRSAAQHLCISPRQVYNLLERYRAEGPLGLRSRRIGKPSNHQLPLGLKTQVKELILKDYSDFGPTLAAEKLKKRDGIIVSVSAVRQIMITLALWVPRRHRPPKIQQPRPRRACFGELIQIDGCHHDWFEGRAPDCTLIAFVDDATSLITAMRFVHSESTFAYFETLRLHLNQYGRPLCLYSDKASVFKINHPNASGETQTQFARALDELNIDALCANSPQAKGRVERSHQVSQDRLVKEMRLDKISSIEAANAWLPHYIADNNSHFGKPPRNELNVHRPLREQDQLDEILVWKETRVVSKRLTLQYDKVQYLLFDTPAQRRLIGREVWVYHSPDERVELRGADNQRLEYASRDLVGPVNQGAIVDNKRLGHVLQMAQGVQAMRDDVRSRSGPASATVKRRRGRHPDKVKPNHLGPEQYYKALMDETSERMANQPDQPELDQIAKEAAKEGKKTPSRQTTDHRPDVRFKIPCCHKGHCRMEASAS